MKRIFTAALFCLPVLANAATLMPVINPGFFEVGNYQDTMIPGSVVCLEKDSVVEYTRLAGNNQKLVFEARVKALIDSKECIMLDQDIEVTVQGTVPVSTMNGTLFAVRILSGDNPYWVSANYLPKSRLQTEKWDHKIYGD